MTTAIALFGEFRSAAYSIVHIVQWYHQKPWRRAAGVRYPERGPWRPAMGSSSVVTINTWVPTRRISCSIALKHK